jgi:predicted Ser/Thr protein kinase
MATLLIQESYNQLDQQTKNLLNLEYSKQIASIFSNASVEKFYPQLYSELENNEVKFDDYLCEIHFNNGFMDLKTSEFKQRVLHQHYITEYIRKDYVKSTKSQQKEVLKPFSKIYPKHEDLECILLVLGSCLSGKANIDQDTLFLLGKGSSGKSFTLELTKACIETYVKELKAEILTNSNAKANKTLNIIYFVDWIWKLN